MLSEFEDNNYKPMIEASEETLMNMVYNALINHTEDAIYNNSPIRDRMEALHNVLKYFENNEEYEKCYDIKKIIQKIEC